MFKPIRSATMLLMFLSASVFIYVGNNAFAENLTVLRTAQWFSSNTSSILELSLNRNQKIPKCEIKLQIFAKGKKQTASVKYKHCEKAIQLARRVPKETISRNQVDRLCAKEFTEIRLDKRKHYSCMQRSKASRGVHALHIYLESLSRYYLKQRLADNRSEDFLVAIQLSAAQLLNPGKDTL